MNTNIRVVLDTRLAKKAMDGLKKYSKNKAKGIGRDLKRQIGATIGSVGVGAAIGIGFQASRSNVAGGFGDIVSDAFGSFGAELERMILGDHGFDARAKRAAREETVQAFGFQAGRMNAVPPGAKQHFDSVYKLRFAEERGRNVIESSEDFYKSDIKSLLSGLADLIGNEIDAAVNTLLGAVGWPVGR